ncbi:MULTISPECIES: nuclear transport factor 2 family protein [unclassified Chelatococcus]|uniref:nuclear transport factor 2 family protein n=1 Tax=unclassified Chelatococcus TaxID=2638111 RepID=UPI001BD0D448|nr:MULTISPECIES: nuclear transport factor 2 family protein [unclassified Chelatococcus]MBS7700353.1 nuclear transport factor 2 family protein [Chelatococcus sp. YT9]MBX3556149.1 nuclear transport factor 2 family protein [Chelatococcus sp.]
MTSQLTLEDRAAIEDLIQRHAWLIDHGESDRIGELFTQDATLYGVGPDKIGRAAIAAWGAERAAMRDRRSRHVQSNILLEPVAPDAARGCVVLTLYRHDGPGLGSAAPFLVCEYADRYRKEPDGAWRFAERRLSVLFGEA